MKKLTASSPPPKPPSVIQKLVAAYKLWHEFLPHFPKTSKYTLGAKIDSLFLELTDLVFTASYLPRTGKIRYVQKAITKSDSLKFFLQVAWETKMLDNRKYILLSEKLNETGKMLGGWNKQLIKETSPYNKQGEE